MDTRDLELKLCSPDPIYVGGVPIYPIPIRKISDIGYSKFNADIRMLCLSADDIQTFTGKDISDIGIFRYLAVSAFHDAELMNMLSFWLSEITHCRLKFSVKKRCFTCPAFEINESNFEGIQQIVRQRNGLQSVEEEEENPDNEAARRILQRRKEERLKRRKANAGNEEETEITLADLVSILAGGFGMAMREVMEYDLYQFNNQFNRLKIMDDYDVNVQALMHGAKKENIHLTHWITKIKHSPEE